MRRMLQVDAGNAPSVTVVFPRDRQCMGVHRLNPVAATLEATVRIDMNVTWVIAAAVLPTLAGLLVAAPLWRLRLSDDLGSIAGAGVVFTFVVAFIAREYGEVLAFSARCIEAGVGCRFRPEPFVRYAIFAGIGMVQVFMVFILGLFVEERLSRRLQSRARRRSIHP